MINIMSRISRYQDGILRYIKTKSIFAEMMEKDETFLHFITTNNHMTSILLLTILNGQFKKKKNDRIKTHHGYYVASGIDVLSLIVDIFDNLTFYNEKYGEEKIKTYISTLIEKVYFCLTTGLDSMEEDMTDDATLKNIYEHVTVYAKTQLSFINDKEKLEGTEKVKKTDVTTFKFDDIETLTKYKKLKRIDRDKLMEFIDKKYGALCRCSFVISWMLGLGDDKDIKLLEELGKYFGIMLKIVRDMENLENDINNAKIISTNFIVNYGIYESVVLFFDNKTEFIRGCMKLKIFSDTVKEIIDYLESKIDIGVNKAQIDMKSVYSSCDS